MTAAEKRLKAADDAVQKARDRLASAGAEHANVATQAVELDAAIQRTIYQATTDGTNADVSDSRARLNGLRERAELIGPVVRALSDGVDRAEKARTALIADQFLELREALVSRAADVRAEREEMYQRHAQEERLVAAKVADLEQRWRDYVAALPPPLRPRGLTSNLDVPSVEPNSGLGIYVAAEDWPPWAAEVIAESKRLAFLEGEKLRMTGVPVAG